MKRWIEKTVQALRARQTAFIRAKSVEAVCVDERSEGIEADC